MFPLVTAGDRSAERRALVDRPFGRPALAEAIHGIHWDESVSTLFGQH